MGKLAAEASAVGIISYFSYFNNIENYDASNNIVKRQILPFLKKMRQDLK
jgi:hypothetical protein